jgi:hypothetical protein
MQPQHELPAKNKKKQNIHRHTAKFSAFSFRKKIAYDSERLPPFRKHVMNHFPERYQDIS